MSDTTSQTAWAVFYRPTHRLPWEPVAFAPTEAAARRMMFDLMTRAGDWRVGPNTAKE